MCGRRLGAMTAALFTLALVGLVVYALHRNHVHHPMPVPMLTGSVPFEDRDAARVQADASALLATEEEPPTGVSHAPYRRVRSSVTV
jgi:hypothetical protein